MSYGIAIAVNSLQCILDFGRVAILYIQVMYDNKYYNKINVLVVQEKCTSITS